MTFLCCTIKKTACCLPYVLCSTHRSHCLCCIGSFSSDLVIMTNECIIFLRLTHKCSCTHKNGRSAEALGWTVLCCQVDWAIVPMVTSVKWKQIGRCDISIFLIELKLQTFYRSFVQFYVRKETTHRSNTSIAGSGKNKKSFWFCFCAFECNFCFILM